MENPRRRTLKNRARRRVDLATVLWRVTLILLVIGLLGFKIAERFSKHLPASVLSDVSAHIILDLSRFWDLASGCAKVIVW